MKHKIHQLNILQYMKKLEKYFFYRKKYFKMKKIKKKKTLTMIYAFITKASFKLFNINQLNKISLLALPSAFSYSRRKVKPLHPAYSY